MDIASAVAGAVGGVLSALVVAIFARKTAAAAATKTLAEADNIRKTTVGQVEKVTAEAEKAAADAEKSRAEAEKLRAEAEEIRDRVRNTAASMAFSADEDRILTVFDSRARGFSRFDVESASWDDAEGDVALAAFEKTDDTLVLRRANQRGTFVLWLRRYGYQGIVNAIPVDSTQTVRRLRVRCKLRAVDGQHTVVVTLKELAAPQGQYLDTRRHRLVSDIWVAVDEHFEVAMTGDARLRFQDRSVSVAPSSVQIRDLIVTEDEPPVGLQAPG